jgi:hypothetical protein
VVALASNGDKTPVATAAITAVTDLFKICLRDVSMLENREVPDDDFADVFLDGANALVSRNETSDITEAIQIVNRIVRLYM